MFGDTGITHLMERLKRLGAEPRRMRVRIAGGAQMMGSDEVFNLGKRYYMAARKALWQLGVMLEMEAVGGNQSRNLGLDLSSGEFWVRTNDFGQESNAVLAASRA